MPARISLETLESRLAPAALGSLSFDGQHLIVNLAPIAVAGPNAPAGSIGTVALAPATAGATTGLTATIGSLTAGNLTDSYYLANAVHGATLNVALAGTGPMSVSVQDQFGNVLAQQSGQAVLGLTVTNLPASGGVTVIVSAASPTTYFLTTSLSIPSSVPTSPPVSPPTTTTTPSFNPALAFPLLDPYGVGDTPPALPPIPVETISPFWVPFGDFGLYNPMGTPIDPWSPPAGFTSPSGLPFNPTPPPPSTP
jgi:hypothetical protein